MRNTNIVLDEIVAYTEKNLGNLDSMSSKRKITSRKNRTFFGSSKRYIWFVPRCPWKIAVDDFLLTICKYIIITHVHSAVVFRTILNYRYQWPLWGGRVYDMKVWVSRAVLHSSYFKRARWSWPSLDCIDLLEKESSIKKNKKTSKFKR